jgi:hypothetical protein
MRELRWLKRIRAKIVTIEGASMMVRRLPAVFGGFSRVS